MSDGLPKGWARTNLGEICSKPQYGWTCKAAKVGQIKYLRTTDISDGRMDWQNVPYCEEIPNNVENYRVHPDDILVARAGSVGVSHRVQDVNCDAVFASYLIRFKALGGIAPKYIEFFLKSDEYWQAISEFAAGIAVPNVNATKLASLELPLAPLNEQRRLVAKLEKLMGKVEACQQRLGKIPIILKRFRQSVLAAACSGRLTADWRERNSIEATEQTDQSEPEDGLPTLPDTWSRVALESVCEKIVDCPHSTPIWTNEGRLCVRTTNFKPGLLDLSEVRYVADDTYAKRNERLKPAPGDVLYSREGGILGIACMVPAGTNLCLGQRMMLFRTKKDYSAVLLMHWLNSPAIFKRVVELTGGSASPHLNVRDIKAFPIPVPPLPEQHEIVRRAEVLFRFADQIEARYAKAKGRVDQITQSLLAKAFRGELVPQNPNDEPAAVLLGRIKTERTKREAEIKGHEVGKRKATKGRMKKRYERNE